MANVFLNKKISNRIQNGHPWIYSNEINAIDGNTNTGDIVSVFTHDKKFIGKGYINQKSQITVRLLTRDKDENINDEFFFKKISEAWNYRKKNGYEKNCRLVFGEADFLPALIIDKFNDYFVIQTMSAGIDLWKSAIVKALDRIFSPKGIYERNDVPVRELEGLRQQKGFLSSPFDTNIIINEMVCSFMLMLRTDKRQDIF
jgi:23S rRNA (cytosine1962-C5)-methyltransferase